MPRPIRVIALAALCLFFLVTYHLYHATSLHKPSDVLLNESAYLPTVIDQNITSAPVYQPGVVKPSGQPYSRTLVVPRLSSESVSWIEDELPSGLDYKIYVVDDVHAKYHPPKNKGNEVMVYLTYIIDHYDDALADINIFMHSHRQAWHNNDLMDLSAVQMIQRLSSERVQREGYMNLKCSWTPGCPAWIHPGIKEEDGNKPEQIMIARSWAELFPLEPMPEVLSQPCCSQFAVSKDRIRALPKARYVYFRDWLLRTRLSNYISGRVWEYIWQYVFTGQPEVCVEEHICYCDGYGLCFGGKEGYEHYWERLYDRDHAAMELSKWNQEEAELAKVRGEQGGLGNHVEESQILRIPEFGKKEELMTKMHELNTWLELELIAARKRGDDLREHATETNRNSTLENGF